MACLTELNVANTLLNYGVKGLTYEMPGSDIDFAFEDILISVKSLNTKNYERLEKTEIERLVGIGGVRVS